jgi:hypothetical protein
MAKRKNWKTRHPERRVTRPVPPNTYTGAGSYRTNSINGILSSARPDTGWRVRTPNLDPAASDTWNMMLTNPAGESLYLWVHDINIDFTRGGSYGQSRYRRQFFPKAFNQPTMTVSGRAPNQYQYNLMAAFMRESHTEALSGSSKQTIRIVLKGAGRDNPKNQSNIKGGHKPLIFEGYLKTIDAGAQKFNYAPEYSFEVILAASTLTGKIGIYEDTLGGGSGAVSWMSMFKG